MSHAEVVNALGLGVGIGVVAGLVLVVVLLLLERRADRSDVGEPDA
jgi:hypothetical protein